MGGWPNTGEIRHLAFHMGGHFALRDWEELYHLRWHMGNGAHRHDLDTEAAALRARMLRYGIQLVESQANHLRRYGHDVVIVRGRQIEARVLPC